MSSVLWQTTVSYDFVCFVLCELILSVPLIWNFSSLRWFSCTNQYSAKDSDRPSANLWTSLFLWISFFLLVQCSVNSNLFGFPGLPALLLQPRDTAETPRGSPLPVLQSGNSHRGVCWGSYRALLILLSLRVYCPLLPDVSVWKTTVLYNFVCFFFSRCWLEGTFQSLLVPSWVMWKSLMS